MKKFLMVVLSFALLSTPLFAKESSDAAIRATDQAFATAWNHHDAKAMAASWATNGDLINPFGRLATGRVEIEKLIQDEHSTTFRTSTYTPGLMSIRFLERDLAIAESDSDITGITNPDGSSAPPMKVHILRIVQKKDGVWSTLTARPTLYPTAPMAR